MSMKISGTSKMLLLSVSFTMALLLVRFLYSATTDYRFYGWNTFLAAIPYFMSTQLIKRKKNKCSGNRPAYSLAIILSQCAIYYY